MRTLAVLPFVLAGCWDLDVEQVTTDRVAFAPDVGAPEGWWVQGFEMELTCPDGSPAMFFLVYPGEAAAGQDAEGEPLDPSVALPVAVVFHSGATDFVVTPTPEDPAGGVSWQETLDRGPRLSSTWASRRVFSTLGLYPNYDPSEIHAGTLAAALATKGIASLWPIDCWGDGWHNRSSVAENDFAADLFFRDGRTAAEFAFLHATGPFPPGNPVELPVAFDPERVYLVGLGDGARAVGEILTATTTTGAPLYDARAAVLDTPEDDWSVLWSDVNVDVSELGTWRTWAKRVFDVPDDATAVANQAVFGVGAPSKIPGPNLRNLERLGLLLPSGDAGLPGGINNALRQKYLVDSGHPEAVNSARPPNGRAGVGEVWLYESVDLDRPLSNANPLLAKAVADFLGADDGHGIEDVERLDPGLVQ